MPSLPSSQGKSHPDTGRSLQSCIFVVLESGDDDSPAVRTPPSLGLPQRSSGRGGWGLPGTACNRLHPGRSSSPSLSAHLQAVRPRSECSPPQARGHAPSQVVQLHHHFQLSRSAQVCGYSWRPPNALFTSHQQCASHQDSH